MDREISIRLVEIEKEQAIKIGAGLWEIVTDKSDPLKFTVTMSNRKIEEPFIIEFQCDNYKEIPALIEFIDCRTGQRGMPSAYPKGDSLFHNQLLVCHPCNRKAYKGYAGLHNDWEYQNWVGLSKGNSTLGDIIMMIYCHLQKCDGRMA